MNYHPSDAGLCGKLLVKIRDNSITMAFPELCNYLRAFTCKAQQILKEAILTQHVHGTSGSPPNIGTLTGNKKERYVSLISNSTCQKSGASEVKVFAHKMATLKWSLLLHWLVRHRNTRFVFNMGQRFKM